MFDEESHWLKKSILTVSTQGQDWVVFSSAMSPDLAHTYSYEASYPDDAQQWGTHGTLVAYNTATLLSSKQEWGWERASILKHNPMLNQVKTMVITKEFEKVSII